MEKRIIYTTEAGGVAVVIPAPQALESMSLEEIAAKDVPQGVPFEIVDAASIPTDRTFRNGWEKHGKTVRHNLTKCKAIAHEKRREARAVELAPLDIEATIPGKAAQAEAARQAIRDKFATMQTDIDAAQDVAALKRALGMG